MSTADERKLQTNQKFKNKALELAEQSVEIIEHDKSKKALLLCEGTKDSMDVFLYSIAYPEFVVIPVGGCSDIKRLLPFLKKYFEYDSFGLIDRDNCSKNKIRYLADKERIYCTKLPFIENILCCPELIKLIAKETGRDYASIIRFVRNALTNLLAEKMSLLNPFNIELPNDNEIQFISVSIVTKTNIIQKKVDLANVMYTFRSKAIVGFVADAMNFRSRDNYYNFLKKQIKGPDGDKYLQVISKYLPTIFINTF